MTDAPSFILPHASGGGEPRICAVEGVSAATLAAMLTPPPPCSAWFPSPAFAGEDKTILFSRRARRPRFAYHHNNKALLDSPPAHKEGSGAPRGASNQCPRHTIRCRHLTVRGARKRAKSRGALAFRRSTAALAKAVTPWLSSRPCFLGPGPSGRYPPFPVPVQGLHLPHRP